MKYQPGFTDFFMSPVTGRIVLPMMPDLDHNYVWIGNRSNQPLPSPIIIDLRLELINIRRRLSETRFILQSPSLDFDSSQALDELRPGILKHNNGIVEIATLPEKNIWIGDVNEDPVPHDRIFLENLPSMKSLDPQLLLGAYNLYSGDSSPSNLGNPIIIKTLNITNMADLKDGWFWMGANSTDPGNFGSNRPVEIQFLPIANMPDLPQDYIWVGDSNNRPVPTNLLPIGTMPDLQHTYIWIGDISNRPFASPHIEVNNLPDLSYRKIWRGDISGRPIESDSLSDLETTIAGILFDLGALQFQVGALETAVAGLVAEVAAIQGQLLIIGSTIAGILAALTALQTQIDNTNIRIDNLRLNNIPIDGDIDMHGYRITNLPCDPIYDLEPTTLCFIWHLMHDEVEVLWP